MMRATCDAAGPRELRLTIEIDPDDLHLEQTMIGVRVHLEGCRTIGDPGEPALPRRRLRVALPAGATAIAVAATASASAPIAEDLVPVAPLQPLRPGATPPSGPDRPIAEPFPAPAYVPPDVERYASSSRQPLVRVAGSSDEGLNTVATLDIHPVRLRSDGRLELHLRIDIAVTFDVPGAETTLRLRPPAIVSRSQAMRQVALTRLTVINRDDVLDYSDLFPIINHLGTDYLIVTDNQRWDAQAMMPVGPADGDLVGAFERLAGWKAQRGLRARVVTIADIVANRYGDFRSGSRDLQEVIRRFLKMAYASWGVAWVMIGGDTDIVPIRHVASDALGGVTRQAVNPPPPNSSCWTGIELRIHAVNLGTWWRAAPTNLLVRPDTGMVIPYDAAGTSSATSRGWFFTTDQTYATRSTGPTPFVRVNGPAGEINADVQFLYSWNTIPTDLYYASLIGPFYGFPGQHDWDLSGNGVYGQHGDHNLDGVTFVPSVSLGRAPVGTAAAADAFVGKVMAYEKFEHPDGTRLDEDWTRRLVMAAENWGGRLAIARSASVTPGVDEYHHAAGAAHALIHLGASLDWSWTLLAYLAEGDLRAIPYRPDAGPASRGWYFATSSTNLAPSVQTIAMPSGAVIQLPRPSAWVAVFTSGAELDPSAYIFNSGALDDSLADQEQLRVQLRKEMPGLDRVERLYEDIEDMTAAQVAAAPLAPLTRDGLRRALDAGPHVVCLSGHGNVDGCCRLGRDVADALRNGHHTFVAYADSCLTNQLDDDALSERLIGNPNGGAVAYVGNTRFSWIGVGDDYQRRFFSQWAALAGNAHLGLLHDTRALVSGSDSWWDRWAMLSLNLAGDPEMPLWWRKPFQLQVPEVILWDRLRMILDEPEPPEDVFDLPYRRNWELTHVHLRQGQQEQLLVADRDGFVDMPLDAFHPGMATLTVSRPGHQPVVQRVEVNAMRAETAAHRLLVAAIVMIGSLFLGAAAKTMLKRFV